VFGNKLHSLFGLFAGTILGVGVLLLSQFWDQISGEVGIVVAMSMPVSRMMYAAGLLANVLLKLSWSYM
jgi:hypothetical protein